MSKKKLFISYSRDDLAFVTRLVDALRKKGEDVWFDSQIRSGNQWDHTIEQEIRRADVLITVLSETSVASHNVMDEVSLAIDLGKTILPVKIQECEVPMRLRRFQYVDFTQGHVVAFERLLHDINTTESAAPRPRRKRAKPKQKSSNLVPYLVGGLVSIVAFIILIALLVPADDINTTDDAVPYTNFTNDPIAGEDLNGGTTEPVKQVVQKEVVPPPADEISTAIGHVVYQNPMGYVLFNNVEGGYPYVGGILFAQTALDVFDENRIATGDVIYVGQEVEVLDIYPVTNDGYIFLKVRYMDELY
ncbi:toll/interleukin-1 receptor domain-containing protein [Maribacter sp.]|nr:toll/interleukin-1 receptor domain-containing protein [Maribacter sp.]